MDLAGYSRTTKIAEVGGQIKEEIIWLARTILAMHAPQAAFGVANVLDDPWAMGARNAVSAAHEVLDRAGLVNKEQLEVNANIGGLLISSL